MADVIVRTIATGERDAVLDLLAGWFDDRAFFARYFAFDPSFRDDLCFVAERDGTLVSTLQVFRKTVQAGGAALEVGCVGNVYTDPTWRGRGCAGRLLERAIDAMHAHRFDASLLFATRLDFYAGFGWRGLPRRLSFLAHAEAAAPLGAAEPVDLSRDLEPIMAIYAAYGGALPGAVRRDPVYWRGQLRYAGNPGERFVVARRAGEVVAYARATGLYDLQVVIEHGCRDGETEALAALIADLHHADDHPGTLAQLVPDAALEAALRARGLEVRTVEDRSWMWRPICAAQLAARLAVPAAAVHEENFFAELFPADRSRYWMADRF